MDYLGELTAEVTTDALGRGIGKPELREFFLQATEPVEQPVIFQVTHQRTVIHIIGLLILPKTGGQLHDLFKQGLFVFFHRGSLLFTSFPGKAVCFVFFVFARSVGQRRLSLQIMMQHDIFQY